MSCPPDKRPDWPFDVTHSPEELVAMRAQAIRDMAKFGVTGFTCDACPQQNRCDLVFDGYNTDGDCLADK